MANYTRRQLEQRWEKAKTFVWADSDTVTREYHTPGTWEVTIFPRWLFKNFLDRKIFERLDSGIMSRNVSYDPDSDHTQEWGWYRWRYYFNDKEGCYVLELDYDVEVEGKKALPLVKGILDIALLESSTSIIGKFKWRSPLLQKIPLIRRIRFIKAHRFLFYFEMKKIEPRERAIKRVIPDALGKHVTNKIMNGDFGIKEMRAISFPKGSKSWERQMRTFIADPRIEGKCISLKDTGDGETFTGEDHICFQ